MTAKEIVLKKYPGASEWWGGGIGKIVDGKVDLSPWCSVVNDKGEVDYAPAWLSALDSLSDEEVVKAVWYDDDCMPGGVRCPTCLGEGKVPLGNHYVTRDMALDAGEPAMEGMYHSTEYGTCTDCEDGMVAYTDARKRIVENLRKEG